MKILKMPVDTSPKTIDGLFTLEKKLLDWAACRIMSFMQVRTCTSDDKAAV